MATASLWKDMDKFCLCSICLEQFKEPKLLPCLHRFCKDCLYKLLQTSMHNLTCPECREETQIPTNGVEGFKTDFYMKNLVEYVQIQQSLLSDEIRECYIDLKHLKAAAYCYKCNNFLFTDCYQSHMTNNTLKDHKQHTLSVGDIESKNITPEKLAAMRDTSRCQIHPLKVSELYCETCNNEPVCVACMFGKHKGHNLHEVTELARVKRQMLHEQLKVLGRMKVDRNVMAPSTVKEKLIKYATSEKEKLHRMYNDITLKEQIVLEHMKKRSILTKDWKKFEKQKLFDALQSEMEKEIQEVRNKYETMYRVKETEMNDEFSNLEKRLTKHITKSSQKLGQLDKSKKELLDSIDMQLNEKLQTVEAMRIPLEIADKRFDNLSMMASNILESENDETAVQWIPDLCTAATNLMEDLRKEFPHLETLTNVKIDYQQSFLGKLSINKMLELVGKKVTFHYPRSYLHGATRSGDGCIVTTGCKRRSYIAFISVIDANGTIIKQKEINSRTRNPCIFCDFISKHKVVFACEPNTIGVYDVCDGSYWGKIIDDWPVDWNVRCVAADPVNSHVFVGGYNSRDVYVFDGQLNYLHILTFPEMIKWPRDIIVGDGHLLVCDYDGEKAFVTSMEELEGKVVREFINPDLPGVDNLRPLSICKDKDGFIYILWKDQFRACYCVQYIHDGSQILTTRKVDTDATAITAVQTVEGEDLVVATQKTQTLYSYRLIEEN